MLARSLVRFVSDPHACSSFNFPTPVGSSPEKSTINNGQVAAECLAALPCLATFGYLAMLELLAAVEDVASSFPSIVCPV